jgi:crotonobetainyl-CoA:carnitine CoA-transferase CaiB-like acyl-CoA transferase
MSLSPMEVLHHVWQAAGLPLQALQQAVLTGTEPVLPSSFAVGTAAQTTITAAALAAAELGRLRNGMAQQVTVDMRHAALECCTHFLLDGRVPPLWDKVSGLYPCGGDDAAAGWVRIHANFAHHRDGALRLLGLPEGTGTGPAEVRRALHGWSALDFEQAAADAGLVVAALRSFDAWDAHAQGRAVALQPLLHWQRLGDAPPRRWPALAPGAQPLRGLRVLDLTRILAGPVGTRTLAAHGAEVLLVNSPKLPNIEAIAETSPGKLSALADLHDAADRNAFDAVLREAHVFVQGYRPGGLQALGYGAEALAAAHPGIVVVSLSAYGPDGPWAQRRGFDSLVQTATGINDAEGRAFGNAAPRALPMQILDHASGQLIALAACAALWRQRHEGGSWQVQVSLAATGHWLRGLGRVKGGFAAPKPDFAPYLHSSDSGFGRLTAVRPAAQLSSTPAAWTRPSMPPGSHPLAWPASG